MNKEIASGFVNFQITEMGITGSDSLFIGANGLNIGFNVVKAFSKTYEIRSLTLSKPWVNIIQDHKKFNFDDLIERFTPKEKPDTTKGPIHFNLLNIKIADGEFHYNELAIPVNYYIREVNFKKRGYAMEC